MQPQFTDQHSRTNMLSNKYRKHKQWVSQILTPFLLSLSFLSPSLAFLWAGEALFLVRILLAILWASSASPPFLFVWKAICQTYKQEHIQQSYSSAHGIDNKACICIALWKSIINIPISHIHKCTIIGRG